MCHEELCKGSNSSIRSKEGILREERRVLYVAMTRTIDNLFVMYPTQYENRKRANKISKFVEPLKPKDNPHIDFIQYDSSTNSNISTTFNAVF
ncbi:MAG: Plasmid conjugative transfer DNA helicase TrhI [Nitrosopumilus sp.]|nr:Plasmid conjugative transfer DNA helicase TrhI [Candidatus Nitrosopumilus limneticus]